MYKRQVPVQGRLISILFCATISVVGILVQLLLESRKRKRRNLEKAAEIRETHSTENEVEKARSLIADLDTVPGDDSGEAEEQDIEIIDLGVEMCIRDRLSGVMTAYLAANPDRRLEAAAAAVCMMGVAGETGWSRMRNGDGNATYRNRIIDAVYNMTGDELEKGAKYELR